MSEHTSEKEQNEKQNELTSHGTKVQAKPEPKEELDDLPELDELDEEEQKEFGKMTSFITREVMERYSGPLPHPKILSGYEQILPGTADRIVAMAEREQEHRHNMQEKMIKTESRDSVGEMVCAFVLSVLCIIGAVLVVYLVPTSAGAIAGALLGMSGMGSVIIHFLNSTRRSPDNIQAKEDDDE